MSWSSPPSDPSRARVRELSLKGPAGRLSARLVAAPCPILRAVVAHPHPLYGGTMDNTVVQAVVGRLAAAGAAVLIFDFRGVRESEGRHDGGAGEQLDLLAAERELEGRFPDLPHWLAGYSFGAFVALARTAGGEAPAADALVALAPPLAHREVPAPGAGAPPIALVTGELDPLTPQAATRGFVSALATLAVHEVVPGAGHDLNATPSPGATALEAALERAIDALLRATGEPGRAAGAAADRDQLSRASRLP